MKKLLFLTIPAIIFAKSFMISTIPLPKAYIQNLDPYGCNENCMRDYLEHDMIFSFLAHANKQLQDKTLDSARALNFAILNIGAFNASGKIKIALLLPYKKIGRYAASTVNATFAYLMTRSNPFILKSYRVEDEDVDTLTNTLEQIKADGFEYLIAPLTKTGAINLIAANPNINVYIPTINKDNVETNSPYLFFGGIDYKAQSDLLLKEATSPLVIFSGMSPTGKKLALYQEDSYTNPDKVIQYFISRKTTNLQNYLKKNRRIAYGTFIVNTPVIKTGMILSQLTLYDTKPRHILSTQINYNPLLLSMTQYGDRKNMIIANSIIQNNDLLIDTNSLLGNDIVYNWINYTTTVGMDYFYSAITGDTREFNINLQNNQMVYDITLVKPGISKFTPYKSYKK